MYARIDGRKADMWYAKLDGVQDWMDDYIFAAGVKAEEMLLDHRQDGHSFIDIEQGRIDRYLILNDERGQKAALSIEFGRAAYEVSNADGTVREVGAMEGLFILHKAMQLKRKPRAKVKV